LGSVRWDAANEPIAATVKNHASGFQVLSKESWHRGPGINFIPASGSESLQLGERGGFWPSENSWNNGMVASGSESLRIGEKNGIWGYNGRAL